MFLFVLFQKKALWVKNRFDVSTVRAKLQYILGTPQMVLPLP